MGLMYANDKGAPGKREPIIHIIDTSANFPAAAFLPEESSEDVWYCFVKFWARLRSGDLEFISVDHGTVFTSGRFETGCRENYTKLHFSGTEA